MSLRAFLAEGHAAPVEALGAELMRRIAAVVPVLSVPLVAAALGAGAGSREELLARMEAMVARLQAAGAVLKLPPQGVTAALEEGLAPLIERGIVTKGLQVVPSEARLLAFYAAAVPEV